MRRFPASRLPADPDAAEARRDARLVRLVATCALRGQGGRLDAGSLLAIAQDERMAARTRRRAAELLARAQLQHLATMLGTP
jgi:hypothetical protein